MSKLILCMMLVLSCSVAAYGWGPLAHGAIADRIMEDADITYQITRWGLSKSSISNEAALADLNMPNGGPMHNAQWSDTSSLANFTATWMTSGRAPSNQMAGFLLHNIADTAVPACHGPAGAWYCRSCMENQLEAQGEVYSTPGWPNPRSYAARTDYNGNIGGFYNNMYSLTIAFKNHNSSYWPCKYFCVCQTDWIDPDCRRAAMKNAYVTFWWYLANR